MLFGVGLIGADGEKGLFRLRCRIHEKCRQADRLAHWRWRQNGRLRAVGLAQNVVWRSAVALALAVAAVCVAAADFGRRTAGVDLRAVRVVAAASAAIDSRQLRVVAAIFLIAAFRRLRTVAFAVAAAIVDRRRRLRRCRRLWQWRRRLCCSAAGRVCFAALRRRRGRRDFSAASRWRFAARRLVGLRRCAIGRRFCKQRRAVRFRTRLVTTHRRHLPPVVRRRRHLRLFSAPRRHLLPRLARQRRRRQDSRKASPREFVFYTTSRASLRRKRSTDGRLAYSTAARRRRLRVYFRTVGGRARVRVAFAQLRRFD